ncbi:MAG: fumarylacetoacetate hydrolase family protein [Synergistes sp.]|nr:fumarylacetoacetate hydrolase family protein [Synergistes sp.]
MESSNSDVRFCRFVVDGRMYSGEVHGESVSIVEGDPINGITARLRISYPCSRVKFLPPIMPKKIWCVGRNYADHAKEFTNELPKEPLIFLKSTSAVTGDGDFIRIPPEFARPVHYEGELAVIIGEGGKNIPEAEAYDHVLGYTLMNDVSARGVQSTDCQWTRSKSFDTFAPMGPCILLRSKMPEGTHIVTHLNGRVVQNGDISQMIFSIPRIISFISTFATLERGDMISTGTSKGVGELVPGDRIEIGNDMIGTLRNICVQ